MSPQPQSAATEQSRDRKLLIARGEAGIPLEQSLPALVSLAGDSDTDVSRAAQETLARMPEEQCRDMLVSPSAPEPVLRYFLDPAHVRPALLATLLGNPASPQDAITLLAGKADVPAVAALMEALDRLKRPSLLALKENRAYLDWQNSPASEDCVVKVDLLELLIQETESQTQPASPPAPKPDPQPRQKESIYSKITQMNVARKVVLALRGSKEERAILIRDGSKAVSRAVLGSPKLTEAEVENFACLKNVNQDVLRMISLNRKFMKNYVVAKNLISNPRCPIDVGLALLNRMMLQDLRALASNRDIPETIRKMAGRTLRSRQER